MDFSTVDTQPEREERKLDTVFYITASIMPSHSATRNVNILPLSLAQQECTGKIALLLVSFR